MSDDSLRPTSADTNTENSTTDTANGKAEFPHKLRVHALAKTLGLTSKDVLARLAAVGVTVRSPQSSIDRSAAVAVRNQLDGENAEPVADTPAAVSEQTQFSNVETAPSTVAATTEAQVPLFLAATAPEPTFTEPTPVTSNDPDNAGDATSDGDDNDSDGDGESRRPRRGRRGRGRGRGDNDDTTTPTGDASTDTAATPADDKTSDVTHESRDGADESQGDSADVSSHSDGADVSQSDGADSERKPKGKRKGGGKGKKKSKDRPDTAAETLDGDADADGIAAADDPDPSAAADDQSAADQRSHEQRPQRQRPHAANGDDHTADAESSEDDTDDDAGDDADESGTGNANRRRRRRRRRKSGESAGGDTAATSDDPPNTVVHEREPRVKRVRDEVQGISGSTRLEAKRQRRRDGRDAGRRRPPILTEAEFLARREAVDRVMVVRDKVSTDPGSEDYTQVAVLEDKVLVEHFVTTSGSESIVGNIYLGRVQNVLPGMEAAFVDIGTGRNGVLYAGEVNWDAAGLNGGSRKIEEALKPGDQVLVQVSKDPLGHKGARLTTQVSLAGRYLVLVPGGSSTGISRKLPDVERKRLKKILSEIVPAEAGVIIRTASEGISAEELTRDIERLRTQWETIQAAVAADKRDGVAKVLYTEPDLLVKVVRDLFNEDFSKLVVEGERAWELVQGYVGAVAPDLMERVERFEKPHADAPDVFAAHRIDEQLAKALDRKVWLPSGGTLIIDRTEALTVVDVNTGKFTGSGSNLEETVTRNNLEAAEEIVRQMRLRDIGGMIIVDFIDMVLESNRDLVLRRLTEALGRDRTRHQVSEVTSLGLVQMTRKRLGTGLIEAFSTTCDCCQGRGIIVHATPVEVAPAEPAGDGSRRARRRRKTASEPAAAAAPNRPASEHPLFKAMAAHTDDDTEVSGIEIDDDAAASGVDVADAGVAEAAAASEAAATAPTTATKRRSGAARRSRGAAATTSRGAAATKSAVDLSAAVDKALGTGVDKPDTAQVAAPAESAATAQGAEGTAQGAGGTKQPAGGTKQPAGAPAPVRRRTRRKAGTAAPVTAGTAVTITVDPASAAPAPAARVTTVAASDPERVPAVAVRKRPRKRSGRSAGAPAGSTASATAPTAEATDSNGSS